MTVYYKIDGRNIFTRGLLKKTVKIDYSAVSRTLELGKSNRQAALGYAETALQMPPAIVHSTVLSLHEKKRSSN
jgi:hypothetical protein